ncbi:hypothetical protein [Virgibacillus sp. SK37]|nr:hypothetical protein [Virgibacillus sp. SK37]AIF45554.1 hypothetical protein X953_16305 [Virgibacillus sp. SK37]
MTIQHQPFGNGRSIRNIYEGTLRNQAVRLQGKNDLTLEDLITIDEKDIN